MALDVEFIFNKLKNSPTKYDEEIHCKKILSIMIDKGRYSAFCTEVLICEKTFYNWINENELFAMCYALGKMFAREKWEKDGEDLRDQILPIGTISYGYEHWKMMGWSRFGISKNSRIKLNLKSEDTPDKHYSQLLKQASEGDFTAGEIKQLMEAVNVGLNTHQVFQLQKEIDELKSDLETMVRNSDVKNNSFADKGTS